MSPRPEGIRLNGDWTLRAAAMANTGSMTYKAEPIVLVTLVGEDKQVKQAGQVWEDCSHDEHLAYDDVHWQFGQHLTNGSGALVTVQGALWEGRGILWKPAAIPNHHIQ